MDSSNQPSWPTSPTKPVVTLKGHSGSLLALAFTPDRGLLASAGLDGPGRVWDVGPVAGERGRFGSPDSRFHVLCFAPTSRLLAAGSGLPDGLIRLFDVSEKTPKAVATLRGSRGTVEAIAFSPDGKIVAGAGEDGTVRIWDLGPGARSEPRAQLTGHTAPVRALAFAPDGQGAASAGDDGTVRLWSVGRIRSWERAILPHPDAVTAVDYAPDGKTVATAGGDGAIRLWDPTALKPVPRAVLPGHAGAVRLVHILGDAVSMVSVGEGPRVMHWDLSAGRPVREFEVPAGPLVAAALTPDGRYLATSRVEGVVDVFRVAEKRG
jgi:WD40 repeat protein